jgi:hypothetical protein
MTHPSDTLERLQKYMIDHPNDRVVITVWGEQSCAGRLFFSINGKGEDGNLRSAIRYFLKRKKMDETKECDK